MATITPSTERQADLRLASKDPEVTHSGSGDRFTVTFTMEGVALRELQNVLGPRLAKMGVERISRFGMTMSLHGVEAGREGEVFHELATAIEDVNTLRENARDERERSRSAAEAADALAEDRLEKVRDGFHAAREAGIGNHHEGPGERRVLGLEDDGGPTSQRQPEPSDD
jgi:hypothetical protein